MIRLGLTGSIATGKSTVAKMFGRRGVPIYDADQAVHDLYQSEAVPIVGALFPNTVVNGAIDRRLLGKEVLGNKAKLSELEAAVHPLVHKQMHKFLSQHQDLKEQLVILEIPLLFETKKEYPLDKTAVTFCSDKIQLKRAMARDGMSLEKFEAIKARQMPQDQKRAKADFEVDTGQTLEDTQATVDEIIQTCRSLANG